jgi:hypothetical protein
MLSLNKAEKAKARLAYATLILALLLKTAGERCGIKDMEKEPIMQHCTVLIGSLIDGYPDDVRTEILSRIDKRRLKLSKTMFELDLASALIGAIDAYTGPRFTTKPGTRFAYIRANLADSKRLFSAIAAIDSNVSDTFKKAYLDSVFSI